MTTSMEENFSGQQLQLKTTSIENKLKKDDLNERRPQWKTALMEDNFN